jgi:hypothetical protein
MDLASQLIAATMRGAKHEVFDMPTNGSDNAVGASSRSGATQAEDGRRRTRRRAHAARCIAGART